MPPLSELTRILRELANDPETQVIERNPHWRRRMRERGLSLVDIASTLSRGAVTEDQGDGEFGERRRVQARADDGKRIDIIIDINEDGGEIWLITAF